MDDKSAQEDEVLALKSIYEENDLFSFDDETKSGKFYIKVESPGSKEFTISFTSEKDPIQVKYLTPIILDFEFPSDYPSVNKPNYKLSCRWLSFEDLSKLCQKLDELWDQNCNTCVLFTWISFLTDELFDYLKLNVDNLTINTTNISKSSNTDKRAIVQPCSSILLKNYDQDQIDLKFQTSYFDCNVCFVSKLGKECFKFNKCDHVFCNECMKGYFESQIKDGNVKSLTCPQDKCNEQAIPAQVLNLVGIEMFNRYDSLLLKDSLNNMTDIVYCPRVNCQTAVIPDDTLAQCEKCKYVFCSLCRQGYHGIEPCKISDSKMKEVCNQYLYGDAIVKEALIKQYGESRIKRAMEETSSMELIQRTSKQCPSCRSWMQKLDGCNKMICSKCHCYFCWLCMKVLSKNDPYSHFNSSNSECYEKLFEGVVNNAENDNEDRDFRGFEINFDDDEDDDEDFDFEDDEDDEEEE